MKATVNDSCISCGMCQDICGNIFRIGDSGKAEAIAEITPEDAASAKEARDACPVSAISIEE